jgi:hypothetical protein
MLDLMKALRSGEEMGVRMPIKQRNALDAQQAEELFEKVDETGHSNKECGRAPALSPATVRTRRGCRPAFGR